MENQLAAAQRAKARSEIGAARRASQTLPGRPIGQLIENEKDAGSVLRFPAITAVDPAASWRRGVGRNG
jgi:hypothetical protein